MKIDRGQYLQIPNFLEKQILEETVSKVLELNSHWTMTAEGDNATLGLAWYKMIEDGMLHAYHAQAGKFNDLLTANFPGLHFAIKHLASFSLCNSFGNVNNSVRSRSQNLGPYWTKFGFSITNEVSSVSDAEVTSDGLQIFHMDYEGLSPYPEKLFDPKTRAYSAIFSLEAPESGGGLAVIPGRYLGNDFNAPSLANGANKDVEFEKLCRGEFGEPVILEYEPGTVTIIDSFMPHMVQPCKFSKEKTRRTVCVVHYLFLEKPVPHFEYWY